MGARRQPDRHASGAALELSRDDTLVVRAFETWVHADDLRRVGQLARAAFPSREQLPLMTDLAGRILGLSLALAGRERTPAGPRASCSRATAAATGSSRWAVASPGRRPT